MQVGELTHAEESAGWLVVLPDALRIVGVCRLKVGAAFAIDNIFSGYKWRQFLTQVQRFVDSLSPALRN
jgi:hypothetical protein